MFPPPCNHPKADAGPLCPACKEAYDEDPQAYLEYGDHPAGLASLQALEEEMAQAAREQTFVDDPEIPF